MTLPPQRPTTAVPPSPTCRTPLPCLLPPSLTRSHQRRDFWPQLPDPPQRWRGAEESMRDWLQAGIEEDKRRQAEERTRQDGLRLEQRKVEMDMLCTSLQGGVPPAMIPLIFVRMGSGGARPQMTGARSEVLGWFQTSLAKLQAYIIEYVFKDAGGPSAYATVTSPYNIKTNDSTDTAEYAALRDQCTNQLVQVAGEVQNFSFLGVMIIVCMTVFLVILDWTLESIVELLSRHTRRGDLAMARARQADNSWHLLRMAINNMPDWELGRWNVPVLNDGNERFARPHGNAAQDLVHYPLDIPMEDFDDIEENYEGD